MKTMAQVTGGPYERMLRKVTTCKPQGRSQGDTRQHGNLRSPASDTVIRWMFVAWGCPSVLLLWPKSSGYSVLCESPHQSLFKWTLRLGGQRAQRGHGAPGKFSHLAFSSQPACYTPSCLTSTTPALAVHYLSTTESRLHTRHWGCINK